MDQFKIATRGAYRTAPRRIPLPVRLLASPLFYIYAVSIVLRASRKAKRGRYGDAEWCGSSLETLRALERVGVTIDISGIENYSSLPEPCVFIGNHMSTLETFVLPTLIEPYKHVTFIVKQGLVDYPVFRHIMRSRNPITVGRENPRDDLKAVLDGGVERLKAGMSIIVFPQTTRKVVFDPEEFNTIGVKLAKRAGAPVVPIALKTDAWGNGKLLKDYGWLDVKKTVHIEFGKPFRIADRGDEEHGQIVDFIKERLRAWGGEVKEK